MSPSTRSMRVLSLPGRTFRGNPYFSLFCDGLEHAGAQVVDIRSQAARRFAFDVVHVHFPEHYVTEERLPTALRRTLFYAAFFSAAGVAHRPLVWSIHDVHPFKQRRELLLAPYMTLFRRLVRGHVFLSHASQQEFYAAYPGEEGKPFLHVPHGPYPVGTPAPEELARVRAELQGGQEAFVLGYLGDIKAYKGVDTLRAIPHRLPDGRPVRLVIAGAADPESAARLRELETVLPPNMVVRIDGRIPDDRLDLLIRASDSVFLPYSRGWNSGMAMLVLSNHTRLLCSGLPIFQELAQTFGRPWVYTFSSVAALPETLERLAADDVGADDRARLAGLLGQLSFDRAGAALADFYRTLLDRS